MTNTSYRIFIRGSRGVGKSTIAIRFIQYIFVEEYDPTIEDAYIKQWEIGGETCILDILDTAGYEEYDAMMRQNIYACEGMLLIYSVTDQSSFDKVPSFIEQAKGVKEDVVIVLAGNKSLIEQAKRVKEDVVFVLAGNKCDLESERVVTKEEGKRMADEERISFFEVSAKDDVNIDAMFYQIVMEIQKRNTDRRVEERERVKRCLIM
eukprot:TRINITY_DN5652_c0_g1_i5.p1 TRINITY_DN5652_c0_g1~~TRINITY_DN5652_c0_g1_i5.p1  ORF type:complete len:207 (+),score=51.56 TRINITY_DN5652_c0_g1_i5:1-621(+)